MLVSELRRSRRSLRLAVLLVLGALQAVAAVAYVVLVRHAFDSAMGAPIDAGRLVLLTSGLLGAAVGGAWFRRSERAGAERLAHDLVARLRADLFEHALAVDPRERQRVSRGGLLLRFTGDLEPLRRWFVLGVVRLPIAFLVLVAGLGALAATAPRLALVVALAIAVGAGASFLLGPRLERAIRDQRRRRARLTSLVAERLDAVDLIWSSGRGTRELSRVADKGDELSAAGSERAAFAADLRFVSQATVAISVVAALVVGLHEVSQGRATPGDVVASMTLLGLLSPPVREFARAYEARAAARVTEEKLERFRALPKRVDEGGVGRRRSRSRRSSLELDGVRLGGRTLALSRVRPGELVVLAGPNGAGKSTWLEILSGRRRPDEGRVSLGDAVLADLSADARSRSVGVCAPDLPLLSGSISKNIRYRLRSPDDTELAEALLVSGLSETSIGDELSRRVGEYGRGLSDGEKGRVGLARAVLGRPDVLVLDEVEAHLDEAGNARLLDWLRSYDGVVVAATHDSRWIAAADRVVDVSAPEAVRKSNVLGLGLLLGLSIVGPLDELTRPPVESDEDRFLALDLETQEPEGANARVDEPEVSPAPKRSDLDEDDLGDEGAFGLKRMVDWIPVRRDRLLPELDPLRYEVGKWSFRLNGRLHLDGSAFDSDEEPISDDIDIRRGRLAYQVRYDNAWRALVDYEYWGVFPGYRNVFLRYSRGDLRVTLGHQNPPFSLEELISSNELSVQERSLAQALSPGFQTGGSVQIGNADGQVAFGVFGDALDQPNRTLGDGTSVTARASTRMLRFDGDHPGQLHVGASIEHRDYENGEQVRFRAWPEARLAGTRLVNTGRLDGVDSSFGLATEIAYDRGPYALQGEWILRSLDGASSPTFQGGYVQFSTYLTGEQRRYSGRRGTIRPPRPERANGEFELVTRWSWLDLEENDVTGGEQQNWTIGANWQVGRNWRFTLEYVRARARPDRSGDPVDLDILQGRIRFQF